MSATPSPDALIERALDIGARQLEAAQGQDWETVASLRQELECVLSDPALTTATPEQTRRLQSTLNELVERNQAVLLLAATARRHVAEDLGTLRAGQKAARAYTESSG
jgi:hypothetical protein